MKEYTLIDLQTFVAVVESNSFSRAAERLNTSSASVSRRITALEAALGTRLINRTTRQLHLTESGLQYFNNIQNALDTLSDAEDQLLDSEVELKGEIRIAAPMSFGMHLVAPLIVDLIKQYPQLNVHLQLEDQQTNLYADGIDLALRIGELRDSALVATKLCDVKFGYFASPSYLAAHGEPSHIKQLVNHQCLHYNLIDQAQEFGVSEATTLLPTPLSTNNGEVLRDAAIAGLGIIAVPEFIVAPSLKAGTLQPILTDKPPKPLGLYAVRLSRKFTPSKVKFVMNYLRERISSSLVNVG